ncbi:MAG: NAD-dependent epimerase/dehydratase family protein [Flavobacteriales bacterium TMED96]|nr:MAG: NAD-dependent epimerase/dehydratase family protein [Flavobacteriales bacterium TMED96]
MSKMRIDNMNENIKPIIKFLIDIIISLFSLIISYAFLYSFKFVGNNAVDIFYQFSLFMFGYIISSYLTKNYASIWAYASLNEIFRLSSNVLISFLILIIFAFSFGFEINFKALILFYLLFSFFAANARLLRRFINEREDVLFGTKNTIIVGANKKTNEFLKNPHNRNSYNIVGILDDKYEKGKKIFNYDVIGNTAELKNIIKELDIEIVIYSGIFDDNIFLKKSLLREVVNLSVSFLTIDQSLKQDIPLSLSSMDQVKEIEDTLLHKVESEKSKNILVTGGAGYIGIHLVQMLLDDNYNVTILDNFTFGKNSINHIKDHPKLTVIDGDVANIKHLVKAVKDNKYVIALAAIVGDPASSIDAEETLNLNYESSKILTEICNFYEVEKLVFASSCSVYGASTSGYLTEDSPLNPVSLYARTRIYSENYILDNSKITSPTILRLSTVFGFSPRMRYDLVVNTLLIRALRDKKFSVFGGDQWRPFIHCKDVARAFKLAIESDKKVTHKQIFNVGSDDMNFTIDQIGDKVSAKFPESEYNTVDEDVDKRNYKVSFNKIVTQLGFKKKYDIETGLDEMIEKISQDDSLLDYEDKVYSNFSQLKDSFSES